MLQQEEKWGFTPSCCLEESLFWICHICSRPNSQLITQSSKVRVRSDVWSDDLLSTISFIVNLRHECLEQQRDNVSFRMTAEGSRKAVRTTGLSWGAGRGDRGQFVYSNTILSHIIKPKKTHLHYIKAKYWQDSHCNVRKTRLKTNAQGKTAQLRRLSISNC